LIFLSFSPSVVVAAASLFLVGSLIPMRG
jgi:hypothetical protein